MTKAFFNRAGLEKIQKERMDLGQRKNHDYGGCCDTIAICGLRGLATRLMDKAARLLSLTEPGVTAQVQDEPIRDTLLDIGNYADYGVAVVDGTWGIDPSNINKIHDGLDEYGPDEQAPAKPSYHVTDTDKMIPKDPSSLGSPILLEVGKEEKNETN